MIDLPVYVVCFALGVMTGAIAVIAAVILIKREKVQHGP